MLQHTATQMLSWKGASNYEICDERTSDALLQNTLHHAATHCNTDAKLEGNQSLRNVHPCTLEALLQHPLQHTATHCNTDAKLEGGESLRNVHERTSDALLQLLALCPDQVREREREREREGERE